MIDPFGRNITYLRLSVTDRCDFRCQYCMAENMTFLPKKDVMSLEEMERLCEVFISRGIRKIRLTGGEPLVRKNIISLIQNLGKHVKSGALDELTLTTNGSQLNKYAEDLVSAGIKRINVSLDTLQPEKFREITRWGDISNVFTGLEAAKAAGLAVKINMVAIKGQNHAEIPEMLSWCVDQGFDLTLIETMPLGEVDIKRNDQYLSLTDTLTDLKEKWSLETIDFKTGGPARYYAIGDTSRKLGLITPMSHNFCDTCNRIRITCTGRLYMCLGHDDKIDLLPILRQFGNDTDFDQQALNQAINDALENKPERHHFIIDENTHTPAVSRHMSMTGG